jgi:cytochrome P450
MPEHSDPFQDARQQDGLQQVTCEGEDISLILRLQDVRKSAKDWQTFSSDNPFMVVLHSEENVRNVRQLPIETDPPDHKDYRALVQPLFRRPTEVPYQENMLALIQGVVQDAVSQNELEAVREFALPLQCRALTRLLGVPESEAEQWIAWGVHVFHDDVSGAEEGVGLEAYTAAQFARAARDPGHDFFSVLNQAEFRGRPLTLTEKQGFANVAFAGGRDTIINTVASIIVYIAEHPEALDFLREAPLHLITATEEFIRYVSPLTAISRLCPHGASVAEQEIPAASRIGLCWPSANRDEQIFKDAHEVVLDRRPNPHVGFGFGVHNCLGAPHARLIIRSLLKTLCERVERIELIDSTPRLETESSFTRKVGYDSARVRFIAREG